MTIVANGAKLHKTSIDLAEDVRLKMVVRLNVTLATATDLKSQVKFAHWNVKGMHFHQMHLLFDSIATEVDAYVDLVAERATALGGTALGTTRIAAQQSVLPEYPLSITRGRDHIAALVERFAPFGKHIRESIDYAATAGDQSTADVYTEISRGVDQSLWFLEAHIQD